MGFPILQRAVAGVGSAGVTGGSLVIIAHIVPMEKRPTFQSLTGGMFGVASIVAPLVSHHAFLTMYFPSENLIGWGCFHRWCDMALVFLD